MRREAHLTATFNIRVVLTSESVSEENPTVNLYEFVRFRDEVEKAIRKALRELEGDGFDYCISSEPIKVEVEIPF